MHWLSPFFYIEAKFGPLEKRDKKRLTSIEMKIFGKAGCTLFWTQKEWKNFGSAESRTSWRETKKLQIHLAATCNKNEKQQDAKNNAEFVEQMEEDDLEDLWRDH